MLEKFLVADDTVEQVTKLSMKFPSKRGGWLRAVEKQSKEAYKKTLQVVVSEKRRVRAIYFLPLAEEYEGWLVIEISTATLDTAMRTFEMAAIDNYQ